MSGIPKIIVFIDVLSGYGRGLLRGIAKYSRLRGPWVFYKESGRTSNVLLRQLKADGIILLSAEHMKNVLRLNLPSIIAVETEDSRPAGSVIITDETVATATMAVTHLIDRGFQNFAYVGRTEGRYFQELGKHFGRILADHGFETQFYQCSEAKFLKYQNREQRHMVNWLTKL